MKQMQSSKKAIYEYNNICFFFFEDNLMSTNNININQSNKSNLINIFVQYKLNNIFDFMR